MFCTHCGSSLPQGAAFCGECGQALAAKAAVPVAPVASVPSFSQPAPVVSVPSYPPPAPPIPVPPFASPVRPIPPPPPFAPQPEYAAPVQSLQSPPPPPPPVFAPPPPPVVAAPPQTYPLPPPQFTPIPPPLTPPPGVSPVRNVYTPVATLPPAYLPSTVVPNTAGPMPPQMHWAVVLILSWITFGLAGLIWAFKEAGFVKKIDRSSKATVLLAASLVLMVIQVVLYVMIMRSPSDAATISGIVMLLNLAILIVGLMAIFGMRKSIVTYYNTMEPIQLKLSGVMTFFFSVLYFQYHFSRIGQWKKTGSLV